MVKPVNRFGAVTQHSRRHLVAVKEPCNQSPLHIQVSQPAAKILIPPSYLYSKITVMVAAQRE